MTPYQQSLREALQVLESLNELDPIVQTAANWCVEALVSGKKLLICGNGGSAAEAQHLAGELMGRYKENRPPLAAIALSADTAVLTCIGNDYSFSEVFARQLRALGSNGDILIAFTTSGASANILEALAAAKELGIRTIAFLGRDGGAARELADGALVVRHWNTARAQEAHQFLMHALMDSIEAGVRTRRAQPGGDDEEAGGHLQ